MRCRIDIHYLSCQYWPQHPCIPKGEAQALQAQMHHHRVHRQRDSRSCSHHHRREPTCSLQPASHTRAACDPYICCLHCCLKSSGYAGRLKAVWRTRPRIHLRTIELAAVNGKTNGAAGRASEKPCDVRLCMRSVLGFAREVRAGLTLPSPLACNALRLIPIHALADGAVTGAPLPWRLPVFSASPWCARTLHRALL